MQVDMDMCNVNKGETGKKYFNLFEEPKEERPNIGFLLQDVKGYHNGNICNFLKCHFILFIFLC
jgi:hypothetical protein